MNALALSLDQTHLNTFALPLDQARFSSNQDHGGPLRRIRLIDRPRISVAEDTNIEKPISAATQRTMIITHETGRIYPMWLTICSSITLGLVVFGVVLMNWFTSIGAVFTALGFAGIWIFGTLAPKYRQSVRRILSG